MRAFVEKLGSYQIITNLFPGIFFGIGLKIFLEITLPVHGTCEEIVVYYFMGVVINRVSSLIIKPVLKRCKFITETNYAEYIKASKKDSKIDVLSEMNNYFRALLTSSLLLLAVQILRLSVCKIEWVYLNRKWLLMVLSSLLFLFAYKKQTKIICKRVKAINELISEQ